MVMSLRVGYFTLWNLMELIHRRPRHPQTQGFIESANSVLKQKIRMAKAKTGVNQCRQLLPMATLAMNQQVFIFYIHVIL